MYVMENGAKFLEEDEFLNLSEEFFENELNGLLRAEALLSIFVTLSASEDRKRYHVFSEKWRQKGKYWTQKDMYRKEYKTFAEAYEDFKYEYIQCKKFFSENTDLRPVAIGF